MNKTIKKWKINSSGIKKSLKAVIDKKDIDKLTKDAYHFVMNLSGFIAHYDINGFKSNYRNVGDLVRDLKGSMDVLRPNYYITDSFFTGGDQPEYYAAKSDILNYIDSLVKDIDVKDVTENYIATRTYATY